MNCIAELFRFLSFAGPFAYTSPSSVLNSYPPKGSLTFFDFLAGASDSSSASSGAETSGSTSIASLGGVAAFFTTLALAGALGGGLESTTMSSSSSDSTAALDLKKHEFKHSLNEKTSEPWLTLEAGPLRQFKITKIRCEAPHLFSSLSFLGDSLRLAFPRRLGNRRRRQRRLVLFLNRWLTHQPAS